jgi:hypothetical protein
VGGDRRADGDDVTDDDEGRIGADLAAAMMAAGVCGERPAATRSSTQRARPWAAM